MPQARTRPLLSSGCSPHHVLSNLRACDSIAVLRQQCDDGAWRDTEFFLEAAITDLLRIEGSRILTHIEVARGTGAAQARANNKGRCSADVMVTVRKSTDRRGAPDGA